MLSPKETASCCSYNVTTIADVTTVFTPWDNPDNVISQRTRLVIEKVITCGVNSLLLLVGAPCNVANCCVFRRLGLDDRINVTLFSLGLVDLLCVVSWFVLNSFCILTPLIVASGFNLDLWKWTVRKYFRGIYIAFMLSSGCLTMLIAVERFLYVCWPFQSSTLMKTRTMTILIVTVVTIMHLLCLVYPLKFNVVLKSDEGTGEAKVQLPPTRYYLHHKTLMDIVHKQVIMIVVPITTFIGVTVSTMLTVWTLKKAAIRLRKTAVQSPGSYRQMTVVSMLLIISTIYIVSTCPFVILGIIRSLTKEFRLNGKYSNIFLVTHWLAYTLATCHSTLNFFVFYTRSPRFRQQFLDMVPLPTRLSSVQPQ